MEAPVVMRAGGERERDPACHLVASDDAGEHRPAGRSRHLARRQRRRDDRRARMQAPRRMGVVEVERMS